MILFWVCENLKLSMSVKKICAKICINKVIMSQSFINLLTLKWICNGLKISK